MPGLDNAEIIQRLEFIVGLWQEGDLDGVEGCLQDLIDEIGK